MRICIIHHHLLPGGVTQIIHSQALAIHKFGGQKKPPIKLFLGKKPLQNPKGIKSNQIKLNPLLDYLPEKLSVQELKEKKRVLENFLSEEISPNDIIHIHNLNLGKNPLLCIVIFELAQKGYKVFNHCHDFAEDGRLTNMKHLRRVIEGVFKLALEKVLYPDAPGYFYGTINSRDYKILKKAGVPQQKLFLLLNPVSPPPKTPKGNPQSLRKKLGISNELPLVTFPVRGIRRKNLGEFLLISSLFLEEANFLLTLNPKNPAEIPSYQDWKNFSSKNGLPVIFEAGAKVDFSQLLAGSSKTITTSVVEGFGMIFLESWMWGCEIIGRDIPDITQDFKKIGLEFSHLYAKLKIPLDWVGGGEHLIEKYYRYMSGYYRQAKLTPPLTLKKRIKQSLIKHNKIDFCYLDPQAQKKVIRHVLKNPQDAKYLKKINSLINILHSPDKTGISRNKSIVQKEMNLKKYHSRLKSIYTQMNRASIHVNKSAGPLSFRGTVVTQEFLQPQNFYLLRK